MLRTYRRRSGLSQRELGLILGYQDAGQVSRHERSETVPPLDVALAYEVIFCAPVAALFPKMLAEVEREIAESLSALEQRLGEQSGRGRGAERTAQKLIWLMQRRTQ